MKGLKKIIYHSLLNNSRGDDIWYLLHTLNINTKRIIPDKLYLEILYKSVHGNKPNWNNPQTFDEKQLWLKLYYRNPLCVQCSDKFLVREYVKSCGYQDILNPLYAVYDSVNDIEWDKLPDRYYIKANHMSGCNVRCNDRNTFDRKAAIIRLKRGMKHDYSMDSREWNYKNIDRKIIVEGIIEDHEKSPLIDYRFLCYNGRCEYVFIDIGTASEDGKHLADAKRNVYDRNMNLLDVRVTRKRFPENLIRKPDNYDEMIKCAEKLSGTFPFCRIDLYNIDGNIVFGEITFFHSGGISRITPKEWEIKLGENISIELAKTQMKYNYSTSLNK